MTVFEYVVGIHSIVLGLATASLLSTLAEQIKYRQTLQLFWVHSVWCLTLLFIILSGWWAYWYSFETLNDISIFTFLYSFQFSIVMYICARLLSPDPVRESEQISFEDYYFRVKTPFLIFLLYGVLTWLLAAPFGVVSADPSVGTGTIEEILVVVALYLGLFGAAIVSSNNRVHGVVVLSILTLQILGEASQGTIG